MIIKNLLRKPFHFVFALLYKRTGKSKRVNGRVYRFSYLVVRGIPKVLDEKPLQKLLQMVKGKNVVLDIGANIGTIANIVSHEMAVGGTVHSFEPTASTFAILKDAARVSAGKAKIIPHKFAVSDVPGEIYLSESEHSTTNHMTWEGKQGDIVQAVTIDEFCLSNHVVPAVIKIDAEGAEYLVLKGARAVLRQFKPEILLELHIGHLKAQNIDQNKFENLIKELKYLPLSLDGRRIQFGTLFQHSCVHLVTEA